MGMKRTLLVLGMVLALAMTAMAASGDYEYPDPGITSPMDGEVVYENTLYLAGHDTEAAENEVRWAVRFETCDAVAAANRAGNVTGVDDPFTWADGKFESTVDISDWAAGEYCFVLNTELGESEGNRLTQEFYIVDAYVKAGGVVNMAEGIVRGNGTHALEGWVADAGSAGLLGEIEVNYRGLRDTCTFTPTALQFDANLPGTGVRATIATTVSECAMQPSKATFFVGESDLWDRGGIVVRPSGSTAASEYLIDNTPGATGGASWVQLTHGNVHIHQR